jgi:hypothetical protein
MAMSPRRRGILAVAVVFLGGLVALAVANYQTTLLMIALVVSSFSYHPPITRDLDGWGKTEFTARLASKFPVGTPEAALVSTLRKQRFTVDDKPREASFHGEWLPCNIDYEVRWSADASGRLTSVEGDHIEAGCL